MSRIDLVLLGLSCLAAAVTAWVLAQAPSERWLLIFVLAAWLHTLVESGLSGRLQPFGVGTIVVCLLAASAMEVQGAADWLIVVVCVTAAVPASLAQYRPPDQSDALASLERLGSEDLETRAQQTLDEEVE